jgi:hypothetical protein
MPDLPTLTVTAAQATRIQNVFPGATQADRAEAYRAWLRDAVRGLVKAKERESLRLKFEADMAASESTVDNDLTGI